MADAADLQADAARQGNTRMSQTICRWQLSLDALKRYLPTLCEANIDL